MESGGKNELKVPKANTTKRSEMRSQLSELCTLRTSKEAVCPVYPLNPTKNKRRMCS